MAFAPEETESFIQGGNGGVNHSYLKRRTGPQHEDLGSNRGTGVGTYVSTNEDFSKTVDKRSGCGLLCYRAKRIVCAKPALDESNLYYEDSYNDEPWECTFGTSTEDGIWVNHSDQVGTIMSSMVWILMIYSVITISLLAQNNNLPKRIAVVYGSICALALASHVKTTLTDPGSIPANAVPHSSLYHRGETVHSFCSHCQTYKPPQAHHCRICNRCISKMDHHCPWMNNCIGAGNFKHFVLFLCYTWIGCVFALMLFGINYFFCDHEACTFSSVLVQLVRVMTFLCLGTLLFVTSMLMNVTYGIVTGIGTIDRLKMKANDTIHLSTQEPIKLKEIFGIQGYWTWALPLDPVFEDYDKIMGYSIPSRLKREHERENA